MLKTAIVVVSSVLLIGLAPGGAQANFSIQGSLAGSFHDTAIDDSVFSLSPADLNFPLANVANLTGYVRGLGQVHVEILSEFQGPIFDPPVEGCDQPGELGFIGLRQFIVITTKGGPFRAPSQLIGEAENAIACLTLDGNVRLLSAGVWIKGTGQYQGVGGEWSATGEGMSYLQPGELFGNVAAQIQGVVVRP